MKVSKRSLSKKVKSEMEGQVVAISDVATNNLILGFYNRPWYKRFALCFLILIKSSSLVK